MILVSSAVGSNTLVDTPPLRALGAIACPLDSADVAFVGVGANGPVTIGVEVKELGELISSFISGRVQAVNGQLRRMAETYDYRYLLYYGMTRRNPNYDALQVGKLRAQRSGNDARFTLEWIDYGSNFDVRTDDAKAKGAPKRTMRPFKYSTFERFLASPALSELGVTLKQVVDVNDAAAWIAELYALWQKPYADHKSTHTFHIPDTIKRPPTIKPPTKDELQVAYTAYTLPGIGYEAAWALAAKYAPKGAGGLRALFNAGPEVLAEVRINNGKERGRRIGNVVANAVEEAIT